MLDFLVDNIFVVFVGKVFQQTVGIPMGTNCAPLLADIFLYSYQGITLVHTKRISYSLCSQRERQKGGDLTQSYDKSPYTHGKVKRAKWKHKQRHKKVRLNSGADRLRTVSWSNYSHPTGVVNLVYGPNLPTPRNSRVIKRTHV